MQALCIWEKIMKLKFIIGAISLVALPVNSMWCCKPSSIKTVPIDTLAQTREFENRLKVVIAENKRRNRLEDQASLARLKYKNERSQLMQGAAKRAAERIAAIQKKHDTKILDKATMVINCQRLSPFEKAIELDFWAKFTNSEELALSIRTHAFKFYNPYVPELAI